MTKQSVGKVLGLVFVLAWLWVAFIPQGRMDTPFMALGYSNLFWQYTAIFGILAGVAFWIGFRDGK